MAMLRTGTPQPRSNLLHIIDLVIDFSSVCPFECQGVHTHRVHPLPVCISPAWNKSTRTAIQGKNPDSPLENPHRDLFFLNNIRCAISVGSEKRRGGGAEAGSPTAQRWGAEAAGSPQPFSFIFAPTRLDLFIYGSF